MGLRVGPLSVWVRVRRGETGWREVHNGLLPAEGPFSASLIGQRKLPPSSFKAWKVLGGGTDLRLGVEPTTAAERWDWEQSEGWLG